MTPRDIVESQLQHRETPVVPYTLEYEGDVEERLDRYYGSNAWRDRLQTFLISVEAVDTMKKNPQTDSHLHSDPYGSLWRLVSSPCWEFILRQE